MTIEPIDDPETMAAIRRLQDDKKRILRARNWPRWCQRIWLWWLGY